MSTVLFRTPQLVDWVHQDLFQALESVNGKDRGGRRHLFSSEQVLRILVCQVIEGQSTNASRRTAGEVVGRSLADPASRA